MLNHIISSTNARNIDNYLKLYKQAGFVIGKNTVRHEPGLRNGFVYFGSEYIEFEWVENARVFRKNAKLYQKFFLKHPSPFGVAFESRNVEALHKYLVYRNYKMPQTRSKGPRDADESVKWWSFQDIPRKYLPGVWSFALTYETRRNQKNLRQVSIGDNTIFAVRGLIMVTSAPKQRAERWKNFLSPQCLVKKISPDNYRFDVGPYTLEWMTPEVYEKLFGIRKMFKDKFKEFQEIGLVNVLAEDLGIAEKYLKRYRFKVKKIGNKILILPKESDGFTFLVTQYKLAVWIKERNKFGQKIIIKNS